MAATTNEITPEQMMASAEILEAEWDVQWTPFGLRSCKSTPSGGIGLAPVATDMPPSTTARTHLLSTFRRQPGILVGVQLVLSESLRLAKSAFPVRTK
jgi:hypothetical protein